MRVWNGADPRLLNRKHLLAEHREIHALLNPSYYKSNNPETNRFRELGPRGLSLLILRHELVRVAMAVRWGLERHGRDSHVLHSNDPTKHAERVDLDLMSRRAQAALLLYERHALPLRYTEPFEHGADPTTRAWTRPGSYECQRYFRLLMKPLNWPRCRVDANGSDTPWHRDSIKASTYVTVGDDWQRADFHYKADTTKAH